MPSPLSALDAMLIESTRNRDAPQALAALSAGANPCAEDSLSGFSALMLAAGGGCLELAQALLAQGAKPQTNHYLSALDVALRSGRLDCARLLLPLSNPDRAVLRDSSALHLAAQGGSADCVRLVASRKRARALNDQGETPLMVSASSSPAAFEALLDISALGVKNKRGSTTLTLLSYSAILRHPRDAARAAPWRVLHERAWGMAKPAEQKAALAALVRQARWSQLILTAELASPEQLDFVAQALRRNTASPDQPPMRFFEQLTELAARSKARIQAQELAEAIALASPAAGATSAIETRPASASSPKRRL